MKLSDVFWMRQALIEASKAFEMGEVPIGAVLVSEGCDVLARAFNQKESLQDPTAHAEILVLREAARVRQNWRLTRCTLYVTHEPCLMCAGALVQARISRVVWGVREPKYGAYCSKIFSGLYCHHAEITEGILEEECRLILQKFFQLQRIQNVKKAAVIKTSASSI